MRSAVAYRIKGRGRRMYDLTGIYQSMRNEGLFFGIGGILIIIASLPLKKKKKKMIDLLFGVLCIILSISTVLYYTYVTTHPQIKYFEGSYDGLNHYRTYGETEYSFKDNEGITEFI